tara:strand:- start:272 stop:520 length:249 start_codon:yes stop_codon:yes gene_type:complete
MVFNNQSLAIWERISKCCQYHQDHDHQDRQSGQDCHGEWAWVNASERPTPAAAAVADLPPHWALIIVYRSKPMQRVKAMVAL